MERVKIEKSQKNSENNAENTETTFEKYKSEILGVFEIFRSQNKETENNDEEKFNEIFNDAQKIIHLSGKLISRPDEVAEKAKEILVSQLEVLIKEADEAKRKDEKNQELYYSYSRTNFYNLKQSEQDVVNAKLGLVYLGESKTKGDFPNFAKYLDQNPYTHNSMVSEHAFEMLVQKKQDNYNFAYDIGREGSLSNFEGISNKTFVELLKYGPSGVSVESMFKKGSRHEKYSRDLFIGLKNYGDYSVVLDNWDKFKDIKIEEVVDACGNNRDNDSAKAIINKILKNPILSENEKQKGLERVSHQYRFYNLVEELSDYIPNLEKNFNRSEINIFVKWEGDKIILSEEATNAIKERIKSGYIQVIDDRVLENFFEHNYDFTLGEVRKFEQEILVLRYLKPEDQGIYIKQQIQKDNQYILNQVLSSNNKNTLKIKSRILDNDDFNALGGKGFSLGNNIWLFNGLDEEKYEFFKKNNSREEKKIQNKFLFENIERFEFKDEKYEKEASYKEFIKFLDGCYNGNAGEFYRYFENDFSFENYDPKKQKELEQYNLERARFLEEISRKMFTYYFKSEKNPDWTKVGTAILNNDTYHQNASREECLGQSEFEKLLKYGIFCKNEIKLSFFYGLNEDSLKKILDGKSIEWHRLPDILSHFDLPKDSNYLKLVDETKDLGVVKSYYLTNFHGESIQKREKIIQLIKEAQSLSEEYSFITSFTDKFKVYDDLNETEYSKIVKEIKSIRETGGIRLFYLKNYSGEPELKRKEILELIKEGQSFSENDDLIISFVNKFKNENNLSPEIIKSRQEFIQKYKEGIDALSKNKSISESDEIVYENICREVYPQRNYDTYKYIKEYKDRSEDLVVYNFDKNGYEMRLSGVVGYKIKEGNERNPEILSKYQKRLQEIENLAMTKENISYFINERFSNTQSKTLEGKIIEYVREHRSESTAVDLLLAYQLSGQYEQFIGESAGRTDIYEEMEGKEYVMLSELSERYGDLMKETLKEIGRKVSESEDSKLFTKDISKDISKGDKISSKIVEELSKIPEDKLTTETIQKKVSKSIINTFQQMPSIKIVSENFSGAFTKENFPSFQTIFKERIKEIFQEADNEVAIDIQKLETLRQETYEDIKKELDKYEEIKEVDEKRKGETKMSKERIVKGYFSKNRENAHARMIGDICIAANPKMLENKNYFEFVLFDEARKKCVGTVMLLNMEEPNDKNYLLCCPNPSVDLVSQVSAEKLYKLITSNVNSFAKNNNFDGVLLDKTHGHATNRSGLFQTTLEKSVLRDKEGKEIILNLTNKHELSGNYVYQEGLNTIWLKE